MEYPTKEGYEPGVWKKDLPVDENGLIDVEGHWIGCYGLYIFSDVLGWCACGQPEPTLNYIRIGLQLIHNLKHKVWSDEVDYDYDQWRKDLTEHFKTTEAEYFFFYWCDKERLTGHGGSVPGWLEPKGEEILEKLNSLEIDKEGYEFAMM